MFVRPNVEVTAVGGYPPQTASAHPLRVLFYLVDKPMRGTSVQYIYNLVFSLCIADKIHQSAWIPKGSWKSSENRRPR